MNDFFHFLKKLNNNFAAKVFIYLMAVILLLSGALNYIYLLEQQRSLRTEVVRGGSLLAEMISETVRLGVFSENINGIRSSVQVAFRSHGVMGVCVYNRQGDLLVAVFDDHFPDQKQRCLESRTTPGLPGVSVNTGAFFHDDQENGIMEFWSPIVISGPNASEDAIYFDMKREGQGIRRELIGYTRIVMAKEPLHQQMRGVITKTLVIFASILFLGGLLTLFIAREVTGPLNRLVSSIKGYGINVAGTDQLGTLAGTFDSLVNQLENSFATVNDLKKGLEEKVAELESEVAVRREVEAALRESEQTARALLNIPENSAVLLDVRGRVLDANQPMADRLSMDRGALGSRILWDLLPAEDILAQKRGEIDEAVAQGRPLRFEGGHDGCYFDYIILPISGDSSRTGRIAILARDITRRFVAEKNRQDLEVRALTQAKLASLGQISAGIAHEINQPLSYIKVIYESTLRDIELGQLDQEELVEDFTEALRQVGRIALLTDQLRNFGRPDTDQFEPVFLPAALDRTMILMGELIRSRNILLHRRIDDALGLVNGNMNKLEQVFINLLQNSVDALEPENGGEVTVAMTMERDNRITIRISDSGPGVPPEIRGMIFEPFFTTKEVGKGTGLGLPIVYGIIKEHGGAISYESTAAGKGCFSITLPGAICEGE